MILFQLIAFVFLGLLILRDVIHVSRGKSRTVSGLMRISLWLAAIISIAWPNLTTMFAKLLGIQRGADLVLYVFALAFLATTLYFYSRQIRLQSQLTDVVRHLAVRNARYGNDSESTDD